jgi:hypothetical protein
MLLPWKTASQTAVGRLLEYDESPYSKFFEFNVYLNRVVHQHLTYADLTALPEFNLHYFIASFVRNPYDRAYSGFLQLQEDAKNQPGMDFGPAWIRDLVRGQIVENMKQMIEASYEFNAWLDLIKPEQIYEAGRNTNFPLHPAHYWTHSNGNQAVQFVGKVENFEVDFAKFAEAVNLETVSTINRNVRDLLGNSKDNQFGYRYVDRMNSRSIAKINELFAEDFEIFGYEKVHR